jgi:hypothetical protein
MAYRGLPISALPRCLQIDEGAGVVLEIEATPEMIAAPTGEHTSWLGEDEYIIDPRLIQAVRVIG